MKIAWTAQLWRRRYGSQLLATVELAHEAEADAMSRTMWRWQIESRAGVVLAEGFDVTPEGAQERAEAWVDELVAAVEVARGK